MKKIVSLLLAVLFMLLLVSCTKKETAKEFSSNGLTVTLTDAFVEKSYAGYTACYESADVGVFALREAFSLQEGLGDLTVEEYAELVRTANASRNPSQVKKENGLTVIEYSFLNEQENQTYKYYTVAFKTDDAFWLVQFASKAADYDAKKPLFADWAKSVKFGA